MSAAISSRMRAGSYAAGGPFNQNHANAIILGGNWSGLVGMLDLNDRLHKAGIPFSRSEAVNNQY